MRGVYSRLFIEMIAMGLVIVLAGCEEEKPAQPEGDQNAWTFAKLSGDNQTVLVMDTLENRMVVELKDGWKEPIENEQVRFAVIDGNGMVTAKPTVSVSPAEVLMPTDWQGRAAATLSCFDTGIILVEAKVVSRPELNAQFSVTGVQP